MKTYQELTTARFDAEPGDEIWACDSRRHPDRHGWAVMTKQEADEYIRTTPYWLRVWSHWETIH